MSREPDVLVLGGGVIGLACAHYLLQAGRSVHVLERGVVGGATSHGNCGTLTPSHAPPLAAPGTLARALRWMLAPDAPLYIKPRFDPALAGWLLRFSGRCNRRDWWQSARGKSALLENSRRLVEDLVQSQGLECGFQALGLDYVYRDPAAYAAALADVPLLAELGIAVQAIEGVALAAEEPALLPGMAGALRFGNDAQIRPDRYCAELARRVREQGGVIEEGITAGDWRLQGDRVIGVDSDRGPRSGREVLMALGPWSPALVRQLGLRLPIQPGKGYSITYERPGLTPRRPLVLKERSVCVTTWADGFRLGSTMEFAGYDASLNPRRLGALERGAREYLREPTGPGKREEWFGWRPMTWDDLPLLGRAPRWRNLWLATGHGMMGMSMSAGTGRLMADMMCGQAPMIDPAPYSPARFA